MVRRTLDSGVLGQYSIKVQILAPVFCRLAADYIKRMRSMACDFGAGREIGYPLSETAKEWYKLIPCLRYDNGERKRHRKSLT